MIPELKAPSRHRRPHRSASAPNQRLHHRDPRTLRDVVVDFIVVPTLSLRVLYGSVILKADRREVIHFGVTSNPTAQWLAEQLVAAFPGDSAPKVMLRDRDGAYGALLETLGIGDVRTAPRSPWQNGMCERLMGSIRRELLNPVFV